MNQLLKRFIKFVDSLNEMVGNAVSWLTVVLVLLICFDVVVRYFFNSTKVWISELEWHLFALVFLLGAGFTLKHDHHVRVDLFYTKFSPRDKAWLNLAGHLIFLVPWCLLICYYAYYFALDAYMLGETSPDPGGLPYRWIIKSSIGIGMFLLLLQSLAEAGKSWLVISEGVDVEEDRGLHINESI